ncbi:MAG: lysine exporter LysO family protein [Dysgonamonadaceae bacterium]|jgi:uncharacterized membrane protein YbjE (DUF340 family)|nr:lysine exporter LysO family protein [Dysgonamonadaceae bacterium]
MPIVLLILISGAVAGYFSRRLPGIERIGSAIGIVIMLLLFFLGVSVGANPNVVAKFHTLGIEAVLIALGGTIGSILCAWVVNRCFFNKEKPE